MVFFCGILPGATQNDSKDLRVRLHAALLMYYDRAQDARIQRTANITYKYETGFPDSLMIDTQEWLVSGGKYKFAKKVRFPNAKQMKPEDENFEFDEKEVFDGNEIYNHKWLQLYQGDRSPRGVIGGNEPRSAMPIHEMLLGFNQKPYYGLLDDDKTQVYEEKSGEGMFYVIKGELIPESNLLFEIWLSKEHRLYPAKAVRYLGDHITAETTVTDWFDTDEGPFPKKIKDLRYHAREDKVTLEVEKLFAIPHWHPKIGPEELVLEFPSGTIVKDLYAEKSYVIIDDTVFPSLKRIEDFSADNSHRFLSCGYQQCRSFLLHCSTPLPHPSQA